MELMIDSVWRTVSTSQLFRIISLEMGSSVVVVFPLHENRKTICKPFVLHIDELNHQIQNAEIVKDSFPTPGIMLQSEEFISEKDIRIRNQRYEYVRQLVSDHALVYDFCISGRSGLVAQHARNNNFDLRAVYRALRDYWRYGLSINALLPLRTHQGGPGKERSEGTEKKGRPTNHSAFGFSFATGINITESDKTKIKKGYKKYFADGKSKSISSAYNNTLSEFYADKIKEAEATGKFPLVPSKNQFKYWGEKRVDRMLVNKGRKPKGDFERNQRGMTESMHSSAGFPGKVFEIDATTADVHIVSPLNRTINLGRPTIYSLVDRASRMIVGMYVSLGYPSWEEARIALLHAFSSKVDYAKRYGVEITDADWPCHHLPETLIGDRGELNGKTPAKVIPTTGISLDITPAYRPDMKGIVESRFGIFNDESLHELPGTTKGKPRERGDVDPRTIAILTLDEITNILIHDVLKHNNTHTFDDLATEDIIKTNLSNTPRNFWNYYIGIHSHYLREKPLSEMKALLLPKIYAKVTKYGIKHDDIYYTCEIAEKENWYALARAGKEWKIEARFDESVLSQLYVRPDEGSGFILCHLTGKSQRFEKLHQSDVLYMADWKRFNTKGAERSAADLKNYENKNKIVDNAKIIKAAHQEKFKTSKRSNVVSIRDNRRLERQRLKEEQKPSPESNIQTKSNMLSQTETCVSDQDLTIFERLWEE